MSLQCVKCQFRFTGGRIRIKDCTSFDQEVRRRNEGVCLLFTRITRCALRHTRRCEKFFVLKDCKPPDERAPYFIVVTKMSNFKTLLSGTVYCTGNYLATQVYSS